MLRSLVPETFLCALLDSGSILSRQLWALEKNRVVGSSYEERIEWQATHTETRNLLAEVQAPTTE